ncbi:hypothetical protein [Nocardioides currus]|uniref:Uncharacterized protein n=1 Tax=Nocardioides currus TaxID=2133958 RepID=A0A2R7Z2I6_9ACTN|nr:hypothetical protein [Nocardioides currus]PUA82802.1 hypothetical protein C7S10_03560 [Nocardioides currus]
MKIEIDLGRRSVEVLDPEDFTDLRAQATAAAPVPAEVDLVLRAAGAGRADDTHAHLSLAWLEGAADVHSRGTGDSFARMIAFATEHGWVDPAASTVRAHLVWSPPVG